MTIKQDLENLSKSFDEVKLAKKNKKTFIENFAKNCEITEYWQNYLNSLSIEKDISKITDDKQREAKAFQLRSTSCFYKVKDPKVETKYESQFEIQKCGNVRFDGTVLDSCCGHCDCYGNIKLFATVEERLQQAKANRTKATIKLLSNFLPFLNTYNK